MHTQSTQESYANFLASQGFTPEKIKAMLAAPRFVRFGPFAFCWQHPVTGQRGKIVRSKNEAKIDWYQRCIYQLNHS